jgi:hypothetical protein
MTSAAKKRPARPLAAALATAATLALFALPALAAAPTLQLNIPTVKFSEASVAGGTVTIPWLAQYISGIYKYAIGAAGLLAVVMMMYGGVRWLTAGGDASGVTAAKERMQNAAVGLVLVLAAYVILYAVSPELVNLKSLTIQTVKQELLPPFADNGGRGEEANPTGVGARSTGSECFLQTFGATDAEVGKRLQSVRFVGFDDKIKINAEAAADFDAAFREWEAQPADSAAGKYLQYLKTMPFYKANCAGGSAYGGAYAPRLDAAKAKADAAGKPFCASCDLHKFGLAVDIDPCHNTYRSGTLAQATTVPMEVVEIFAKHHIYWGGYGWSAQGKDPSAALKRDGMHFEWHGKCWK